MSEYHTSNSSNERVGMPTHVREILRRARRPMPLGAILEALSKVMPLDECSDPLHYLRGVTTKGVKDGWLERHERGVYQLSTATRNSAPRVTKVKANGAAKVVKRSNGSSPKRAVTVRGRGDSRLRAVKKSLEIKVGDVTLRTPSGMHPDALARIVEAIREASN